METQVTLTEQNIRYRAKHPVTETLKIFKIDTSLNRFHSNSEASLLYKGGFCKRKVLDNSARKFAHVTK